jgi:hypothetical protein
MRVDASWDVLLEVLPDIFVEGLGVITLYVSVVDARAEINSSKCLGHCRSLTCSMHAGPQCRCSYCPFQHINFLFMYSSSSKISNTAVTS